MPTPRKVVRQKAQLLVAIPPALRRQLGASAGTILYWHEHRQGEAVLTRNPTRRGGKAPDPMKSAAIAALEAEVQRLQARLDRQRSALWNEWSTQAAMKRLHIDIKGYPALDAINDRLRDLQHSLDTLVTGSRRGHGQPPRPAPIPSPPPPPSSP